MIKLSRFPIQRYVRYILQSLVRKWHCVGAVNETVQLLKSHLINRVGTFPAGVHQWSGQAVASKSSSLHSSTWRSLIEHNFKNVWYLHKRTLWQSHICLVAYSGHLCFCDLTKPAITVADVDRFYWNLAFCLQLDIALLLQNLAKIRRCLPLPEL